MAHIGEDFNPSDESIPEGGSYEAPPPGKYCVVIESSEVKKTKAGTGTYLKMVLRIQDGPHANRIIYANNNLTNPSDQAVLIGRSERKSLSLACGITEVWNDSAVLHNIPFMVTVAPDVNKETGEVGIKIKKYEAMNAAPIAPAAPVQRVATPAPQPVARQVPAAAPVQRVATPAPQPVARQVPAAAPYKRQPQPVPAQPVR